MLKVSKSRMAAIVLAVFAIVVLSMIGRIGEDVKNETIVVNQFPFTGKMDYWTTPGWRGQWFGKTTVYHKTEQLWFGATDEGNRPNGTPIPVIFNDASDGLIYGSLRVKLPTDIEHLSRIQTDYNGMDRLMNDLVKQTVTKVIYASGPLMSAFESYAEKKNDLIEYITDQLNNGVYKTTVKTEETIDPITGEKKQTKVATLVPDENAPGGFKRSESSPFKYYGIEIGQVSVSKIDYSDKVKQQISQQQEANMLIQTSKAKAAAAVQEAIRAEEEGKAKAAQAKWEQERIKATEVTKAEQEREVSRLAAEKAEFDKKKIIAEGQAEAEANRLKVAAGLTPQERAEWDYKTKVGVAEAISKVTLPRIVSTSGNGNSNAMDAIGLKMLIDMSEKLSK
ncbi:MAG: hypothetical protein J6T98_05605 [Salinivirgaceae bacterium]|nr:hypothetical protein [Salinivirgaceae bacterium]